jgi:nucleoside-diphosphate-sugar epimerase
MFASPWCVALPLADRPLAAAIEAVVSGAKVRFDAPAGTAIALSNRDSGADLGRAKRYLGYEPQFKLHDALQDLGHWMKRHMP